MNKYTPTEHGAIEKAPNQQRRSEHDSPLAHRAERSSDGKPQESSPAPATTTEPTNRGRKPLRASDQKG
ncbi:MULTISPECIES: hypothetical protein [unclassified Pseudomonas]|uniref:hypothetical protein n=1 Tax=unclassified Pseudomonas TaxID=196821 RepID=UPI000AA6376D|nr:MULTISPECIES: hypothetical protein [unclassified Pseudomonas]QOF86732.1 hypothetical protein IG194_08660 [Pseudomonas sp. ADPe]